MNKWLTVLMILMFTSPGLAQIGWSAEKSNLMDAISVSGLLEAEAAYTDPDSGGEESDIALATMELGIDADLTDHVSGHVLLLWEEDDTEPVDMDAGYITLSDGPYYARAGKFYVPFGNFDTVFISDPVTLELGETRESAILAGYGADWMELRAGAFNGDVEETGETDDHVKDYFAAADFHMPRDTIPNVGITAGISYISNIADSDGLSDAIANLNADDEPVIQDTVSGISAYIKTSILDRVFLRLEYLGATDEFESGEIDGITGTPKPRAWNVELAGLIIGSAGVGIQYGGTEDCGAFLPEKRYGAVFFLEPFERTWFGVEYLNSEFENDEEVDTFTAQLAYEF